VRSNEPWKTLETPRIKGWAMSLLYQDGFAHLRELFSLGRRPQDYHIRQAVEHPRVLPLFVEYLHESKIERLWDYHLPLPQRQALVRRLSRTPPSSKIKLIRSKTLITRLVTPAWLQYNQTGHPDKDHLPKLIKRHPWLFVYYLNPSTSPRLAGILNQKIKRP
jgi:hypothetical protein